MQRTKVIIITALYLLGALGVHGQIHFCCGQAVGFEWSFDQTKEQCQSESCCQKKDCCTTMVIDASLEDAHHASKGVMNSWAVVAPVNSEHMSWVENNWKDVDFQRPSSYRGPPPLSGKSLVCLYKNWKIDLIA